VREGNFEMIKLLVEETGAKVDLALSEMVKDDELNNLDQ
jgi:hypothetical protein